MAHDWSFFWPYFTTEKLTLTPAIWARAREKANQPSWPRENMSKKHGETSPCRSVSFDKNVGVQGCFMSALNYWNIKIHVSGLQVSWLFFNGESRRSAMKGHRSWWVWWHVFSKGGSSGPGEQYMNSWLVGQGHPSEKYEFVNWDDVCNPIYGKIKNGNQTTNQVCMLSILEKTGELQFSKL